MIFVEEERYGRMRIVAVGNEDSCDLCDRPLSLLCDVFGEQHVTKGELTVNVTGNESLHVVLGTGAYLVPGIYVPGMSQSNSNHKII